MSIKCVILELPGSYNLQQASYTNGTVFYGVVRLSDDCQVYHKQK